MSQPNASLSAVVLAAGLSSRMKKPKQLVVVESDALVVHAAKVALQSGAGEVIIVTGAYEEEVRRALAPLLSEAGDRLRLVHNPTFMSGQASSIHRALQALAPTCQAVLFLPVDQPLLKPQLLQQLVYRWQQGARLVACTVNGELRGAPAIFDRTLFADLFALEGDHGARPLLQKYQDEIVAVPATEKELRDIDTPEDLAEVIPNST
jgi:molybdenum cofactor cytidylyltransferase